MIWITLHAYILPYSEGVQMQAWQHLQLHSIESCMTISRDMEESGLFQAEHDEILIVNNCYYKVGQPR